MSASVKLRSLVFAAAMSAAFLAFADIQVIDGKKYECKDGLCTLVADSAPEPAAPRVDGSCRIAQGYMSADRFIAFVENRTVDPLADAGLWLVLLLAFLGGLTMNLTPCVLPMIPINLMVIGRSAGRGAAYGAGIAVAYGALGVAAALGGLAFGDIQGSPWFNAVVAIVFVALAMAMFDVYFLDLSRFRRASGPSADRSGVATFLIPFGLGAMSAVLAGACVAPVLISVLVLTADWVAKGNLFAVLLPFVLGAGMALPWPFAGAGMKVLPKPGSWMTWVNRVFGVVVLCFAVYYGWLAWRGFSSSASVGQETASIRPSELESALVAAGRPVLVDCWATWCKNCSAMEKVLATDEVRRCLQPYTVIRVQAEDLDELRRQKGFETLKGLPAFVIFD